MALVNMNEMLEKARANHYAVGNFDICSGELLRGVLRAAQEKNAPVILAYAEVFEPVLPMSEFAPMLRAAAQQADVPVAIHLDHARTVEYIKKAVEHGFTSVMLDASDRPLNENIAMTREVVGLCRPLGVSVESELGHVGGLDGYDYHGDGYTVVEEAVRFVAETGVDALAVSIGTVHGVYQSEPKLNLGRLKELRAAVDVPLVMHGGSGLSDGDFKETVRLGVTKTNIFTDLTIVAFEAMEQSKDTDYLGRCMSAVDAVKKETEKKMELFGCIGKA